jgi:hypothetical protein
VPTQQPPSQPPQQLQPTQQPSQLPTQQPTQPTQQPTKPTQPTQQQPTRPTQPSQQQQQQQQPSPSQTAAQQRSLRTRTNQLNIAVRQDLFALTALGAGTALTKQLNLKVLFDAERKKCGDRERLHNDTEVERRNAARRNAARRCERPGRRSLPRRVARCETFWGCGGRGTSARG